MAFISWIRSPRLHFLLSSILLYLTLFGVLRVIFYFGFSGIESSNPPPTEDIRAIFGIGTRFDLRLAILINLPLLLLLFFPRLQLLQYKPSRIAYLLFFALINTGIFVFYFFDFGHYNYLDVRINSTILRFLDDKESGPMLWQSYPVVWLSLLLVASSAYITFINNALLRRWRKREEPRHGLLANGIGALILITALLLGIFGRVSDINLRNPIPLRWDAINVTNNSALAQTGLNPIVFFFETYADAKDTFDAELAKLYYADVARYLGIEELQTDLSITRHIAHSEPKAKLHGTPNIIVIMLESLGASRVSHFGLPFETTPVIDQLARDGLFMEHFYVPVSGTARTVWASITGIPDVTLNSTASRNPMIANQRTVLNHFTDHEKMYFIGGNASWANITGVIKQGIDGVTLYEESVWKSPVVDVWGISDLDLFKETDLILREKAASGKPFIAYVQTAANHRPFTIPKHNDAFVTDNSKDEQTLTANGFRSAAQYNAVRLLDYNIGRFLELARESGYFDNTIFVMYGDHNNRITTTPHMAPFHEALDLDGLHVPAVIYAPKLIDPRQIDYATSLVDVWPTLAGLLGIPYTNSGFGRDILAHDVNTERFVYTQDAANTNPYIGMVSQHHMLRMRADGSDAKLHDLYAPDPAANIGEQNPEKFNELVRLTRGVYEFSRYQLFHNVEPTTSP